MLVVITIFETAAKIALSCSGAVKTLHRHFHEASNLPLLPEAPSIFLENYEAALNSKNIALIRNCLHRQVEELRIHPRLVSSMLNLVQMQMLTDPAFGSQVAKNLSATLAPQQLRQLLSQSQQVILHQDADDLYYTVPAFIDMMEEHEEILDADFKDKTTLPVLQRICDKNGGFGSNWYDNQQSLMQLLSAPSEAHLQALGALIRMRPHRDHDSIAAAAAIISRSADEAVSMQQKSAGDARLTREYLFIELGSVCATTHLLRRLSHPETVLELAIGLHHETRYSQKMRSSLIDLYDELAQLLPSDAKRTALLLDTVASEDQDSPFASIALRLLRREPVLPEAAP